MGDRLTPLNTVEVLFNKDFFGCVIGKGGERISQIREDSGVAKISNCKETIRGDKRIFQIHSSDWNQIWDAVRMILELIDDKYEDNVENFQDTHRLHMEIRIPQVCAGSLIGKGGSGLQNFRNSNPDMQFNVEEDQMDRDWRYLVVNGQVFHIIDSLNMLSEQILRVLEMKDRMLPMTRDFNNKRGRDDMMGNNNMNDGGNGGGMKRQRMDDNRNNNGNGMNNMNNNNQQMQNNFNQMQNQAPGVVDINCKIILEDKAVGKVIGNGGSNIRNIRQITNATITTDKQGDRNDGTREVDVSGSLPSVSGAIALIYQKLIEPEQQRGGGNNRR